MSVSFGDRVELAIEPLTLDDLVKGLRKRRPRREAVELREVFEGLPSCIEEKAEEM